jgi:cytochrome c-type biogenesis protein
MMVEVTWWLALGAGFLSFISPCVLPVYPSYLSYITGVSVGQLKKKSQPWKLRKTTMIHTLFFILGFSMIFYALGFSFSWMGQWFKEYQETLRMLGAVFIFTMGLFMLGIFKPSFLMREKRFEISSNRLGYIGSTLVGIGFAAGWTPCIGPILSSVLALAAINPSAGLGYITAYNLGFSIPFFVMAFFLGRIRWIHRYSASLVKVGGILMVFIGILLYFNQMTLIINWFSTQFGGFTGF